MFWTITKTIQNDIYLKDNHFEQKYVLIIDGPDVNRFVR